MLSRSQARDVYGHLEAIRESTTPSVTWSLDEIVHKVQKELEAIQCLTQKDEPEEERIKWNLRQIARVASDKDYYREWGARAVVHYVRNVLGHIEGLLSQDEPEVGNRRLESELDAVTRSNAWLREKLAQKDESLRACRAAEAVLKERNQQLATTEALLRVAERRIKSLRATCSKVMTVAEVADLRASNVRLLRRNKRLEEDLKSSDAHIVELQGDLACKHRQLAKAYNQIAALQQTLEGYPK